MVSVPPLSTQLVSSTVIPVPSTTTPILLELEPFSIPNKMKSLDFTSHVRRELIKNRIVNNDQEFIIQLPPPSSLEQCEKAVDNVQKHLDAPCQICPKDIDSLATLLNFAEHAQFVKKIIEPLTIHFTMRELLSYLSSSKWGSRVKGFYIVGSMAPHLAGKDYCCQILEQAYKTEKISTDQAQSWINPSFVKNLNLLSADIDYQFDTSDLNDYERIQYLEEILFFLAGKIENSSSNEAYLACLQLLPKERYEELAFFQSKEIKIGIVREYFLSKYAERVDNTHNQFSMLGIKDLLGLPKDIILKGPRFKKDCLTTKNAFKILLTPHPTLKNDFSIEAVCGGGISIAQALHCRNVEILHTPDFNLVDADDYSNSVFCSGKELSIQEFAERRHFQNGILHKEDRFNRQFQRKFWAQKQFCSYESFYYYLLFKERWEKHVKKEDSIVPFTLRVYSSLSLYSQINENERQQLCKVLLSESKNETHPLYIQIQTLINDLELPLNELMAWQQTCLFLFLPNSLREESKPYTFCFEEVLMHLNPLEALQIVQEKIFPRLLQQKAATKHLLDIAGLICKHSQSVVVETFSWSERAKELELSINPLCKIADKWMGNDHPLISCYGFILALRLLPKIPSRQSVVALMNSFPLLFKLNKDYPIDLPFIIQLFENVLLDSSFVEYHSVLHQLSSYLTQKEQFSTVEIERKWIDLLANSTDSVLLRYAYFLLCTHLKNKNEHRGSFEKDIGPLLFSKLLDTYKVEAFYLFKQLQQESLLNPQKILECFVNACEFFKNKGNPFFTTTDLNKLIEMAFLIVKTPNPYLASNAIKIQIISEAFGWFLHEIYTFQSENTHLISNTNQFDSLLLASYEELLLSVSRHNYLSDTERSLVWLKHLRYLLTLKEGASLSELSFLQAYKEGFLKLEDSHYAEDLQSYMRDLKGKLSHTHSLLLKSDFYIHLDNPTADQIERMNVLLLNVIEEQIEHFKYPSQLISLLRKMVSAQAIPAKKIRHLFSLVLKKLEIHFADWDPKHILQLNRLFLSNSFDIHFEDAPSKKLSLLLRYLLLFIPHSDRYFIPTFRPLLEKTLRLIEHAPKQSDVYLAAQYLGLQVIINAHKKNSDSSSIVNRFLAIDQPLYIKQLTEQKSVLFITEGLLALHYFQLLDQGSYDCFKEIYQKLLEVNSSIQWNLIFKLLEIEQQENRISIYESPLHFKLFIDASHYYLKDSNLNLAIQLLLQALNCDSSIKDSKQLTECGLNLANALNESQQYEAALEILIKVDGEEALENRLFTATWIHTLKNLLKKGLLEQAGSWILKKIPAEHRNALSLLFLKSCSEYTCSNSLLNTALDLMIKDSRVEVDTLPNIFKQVSCSTSDQLKEKAWFIFRELKNSQPQLASRIWCSVLEGLVSIDHWELPQLYTQTFLEKSLKTSPSIETHLAWLQYLIKSLGSSNFEQACLIAEQMMMNTEFESHKEAITKTCAQLINGWSKLTDSHTQNTLALSLVKQLYRTNTANDQALNIIVSLIRCPSTENLEEACKVADLFIQSKQDTHHLLFNTLLQDCLVFLSQLNEANWKKDWWQPLTHFLEKWIISKGHLTNEALETFDLFLYFFVSKLSEKKEMILIEDQSHFLLSCKLVDLISKVPFSQPKLIEYVLFLDQYLESPPENIKDIYLTLFRKLIDFNTPHSLYKALWITQKMIIDFEFNNFTFLTQCYLELIEKSKPYYLYLTDLESLGGAVYYGGKKFFDKVNQASTKIDYSLSGMIDYVSKKFSARTDSATSKTIYSLSGAIDYGSKKFPVKANKLTAKIHEANFKSVVHALKTILDDEFKWQYPYYVAGYVKMARKSASHYLRCSGSYLNYQQLVRQLIPIIKTLILTQKDRGVYNYRDEEYSKQFLDLLSIEYLNKYHTHLKLKPSTYDSVFQIEMATILTEFMETFAASLLNNHRELCYQSIQFYVSFIFKQGLKRKILNTDSQEMQRLYKKAEFIVKSWDKRLKDCPCVTCKPEENKKAK